MPGAEQGFTNIGNAQIIADFHLPNSYRANYKVPPKIAVEHLLGSGEYGLVLLLRDKEKELAGIAVKYFISPFNNGMRAQRCYRELQLLRGLRHPNIAKMVDAYVIEESAQEIRTVYLVMEYAGMNLLNLIRSESEDKHIITLDVYKGFISQLLRALKYLHSAKVSHRDLKPDNIAIDTNGHLTLIDFGLARAIDDASNPTRNPGQKWYRAIEAIAFDQKELTLEYDEKIDMWSLGAILCEMILGEPIFKKDNNPEHDFPLQRAIEICGEVPKNVLDKVADVKYREYIKRWSQVSTRANFISLFTAPGTRRWLHEEVEANQEHLTTFIDGLLVFDREKRMTVDEALAHPFLAEVRVRNLEEPAGFVMSDESAATVEVWKQRIFDLVKGLHQNGRLAH